VAPSPEIASISPSRLSARWMHGPTITPTAAAPCACPLHPWLCWLILSNNPFAPALIAFVAAAFLTPQQLILGAIRVADQARQQAPRAATTEERAWHGLAARSSPPSTTTLDAATLAAALLNAIAAALCCNGIRLDVSLSM